ncbi:MAG: lysophospholipid acyltransferase family protein [Bacillota bacterium]
MFYRFARAFCRFLLFALRRWQVSGKENVPPDGGLIVASNHVSYWDPVAVGCALPRKVFFMAKAELFALPVLGPAISSLGAFPVYRSGSDARAIKKALALLRRGQVVGIFPEGTRSHTGQLLPPHVGAAMLALHGRVPVLPVALIGTRGVFGRVKVVIGRPLEFSGAGAEKSKEQYQTVAAAIMREIASLMDKER